MPPSISWKPRYTVADGLPQAVMSHQRAEASNWASRALSRRTRVIVEESAQTLTPVNAADASLGGCALDQLVSEALVIPLTVVMLDELATVRWR
jgi:hypothetical protein